MSLKISGKRAPSKFPDGGPYGESSRFPEPSFTCFSNSSIKVLILKRNFTRFSKALGKKRLHLFPKTGPYENKRPFTETYLTYPLGSPVKEPSLRFPHMQFPPREMLRFQSPPSFIFQTPRYTGPLSAVAYRGGWGFNPPPKFRSFYKAEPNSLFRGKYIRNKLIRIRVSLI
jgi:hypothetical protein